MSLSSNSSVPAPAPAPAPDTSHCTFSVGQQVGRDPPMRCPWAGVPLRGMMCHSQRCLISPCARGQVGIAMAIVVCWSLLNLTKVDQQGWLNNFSMRRAAFFQRFFIELHSQRLASPLLTLIPSRSRHSRSWQMCTTVAVVATILRATATSSYGYNTRSFVWGDYENATGWSTTANVHSTVPYVACLGILYSCFSFSGYEVRGFSR